jgi:tetratricopeptide (TPR) repeat protein
MMQKALRSRISLKPCALALSFALLSGLAHGADDAPPVAPPADTDTSPYHVALLAYKAGHYEEALAAIEPAYKQQPTFADAILKARILTELGRYDEGEKILAPLVTPKGPLDVELALGDLLLRKRDFNAAARLYDLALDLKPGDPDLLLKMVYTRIGAGDLVTAAKIASQLKPLDSGNPSYYFARAALAQSTDKSAEAEDDIQTVRTMYGITVTNHYLKTYLEVLTAPGKNALITPQAPGTNAPPAPSKP